MGYIPMGEDQNKLGERNERVEHLTEHPSEMEIILKTMQGFLKHFDEPLEGNKLYLVTNRLRDSVFS